MFFGLQRLCSSLKCSACFFFSPVFLLIHIIAHLQPCPSEQPRLRLFFKALSHNFFASIRELSSPCKTLQHDWVTRAPVK